MICKQLKSVVGPLLLITALSASATDGTQLLRSCQDADQYDERKPVRNAYGIGMCFGLVEGVFGTLESLNPSLPLELRFCPPEQRIGPLQAARVVLKYLRENPEQHHETAALLIAVAYHNAFPCKR